MPFPYTFPFSFDIEQKQLRQWQFEVRDASGNIVRVLNAPIGTPILRAELNAPAELRMRVSAYDVAASGLAGQNEIWIRNRQESYEGKFRILDVTDRNDTLGPYHDIIATDYLGQLGDETMQRFSMSGTVENIVEELLFRQIGENRITLGDIDSTIANDTQAIYLYEPTTILRALLNLSESIAFENRFYVDGDRRLQWQDISATTGGERQLWIGKNAQSIERRVQLNAQTTRLYPYGGNRSSSCVRISDADGTAQRWTMLATAVTVSAGRTIITLGSGAGYDTNGSLDAYSGQSQSLQAGDLVAHGNNEYEVRSVTGGKLYMYETISGLSSGAITVIRPYIDSALRGAIMRRLVTIDRSQIAWAGATDYGLSISDTDRFIAGYSGTKTGLGIRAFSTDFKTRYTVSVSAFNTTTGAYSCTVTVPIVSGVRDTYFYLVFGRF